MEVGGQLASPGPGQSHTMAQGTERGRWVGEIVEADLTELTTEDAGG